MFECLPVELLEQIISILDHASPPSSTSLLHKPPSEMLFKGADIDYPLKSLSLTCKSVRSLVAPRLFTHLKVAPDAVQDLVDVSSLYDPPQSLILYLDYQKYPDYESGDVGYRNMNSLRAQVTWMVDMVNPKALTIVASPCLLGWLVDLPLTATDSWVFHLPYQMMRLEQGPFAPSQWFPRDVVHDNHTLSTVRPWNHCTYNEGSFVHAYSTYEYHHFEAPSLHQSPNAAEMECHALQLACLTSFKLVAVFPFNHMENTCDFLQCLPNLEHLIVQLVPTGESTTPYTTASSSSSPTDFWLENETNYKVLCEHVNNHLSRLSAFTSLDYTFPGYRSAIDDVMVDVSAEWQPDGNGTWKREVDYRPLNAPALRKAKRSCPQFFWR